MGLACVLIVSQKRAELARDEILPTLLTQGFDEVVVVGDFWSGNGYRHIHVPPVTRTTLDALMKRDTGAASTTSDVVVYLCDDHRLTPNFGLVLRENYLDKVWDVLVPNRYCLRNGLFHRLNMGFPEGYCGGHAGIYRRSAIRAVPFMAAPHHPNWDFYHTKILTSQGFNLMEAQGDLLIEDIQPGAKPWE